MPYQSLAGWVSHHLTRFSLEEYIFMASEMRPNLVWRVVEGIRAAAEGAEPFNDNFSRERETERGLKCGSKNCFTFFKTKFVTRRLKLAPLAVTCFVGRSQCDQTWRNFAILGTFYVSLAILWGFIVYLQTFQNHFGTFLWYWVNFLCGKRPDVENIWSHWAWRPGGQRTCSLVCRSEFKSRWSNTRIAIGII